MFSSYIVYVQRIIHIQLDNTIAMNDVELGMALIFLKVILKSNKYFYK